MFGETEYDPGRQYESVAIEEQLDALGNAVTSGKVVFLHHSPVMFYILF